MSGLDYVEAALIATLISPVTVTNPSDSTQMVDYLLGTTFTFGYKFIDLTHCESLCKCNHVPEHLKLQFGVRYTDHVTNVWRLVIYSRYLFIFYHPFLFHYLFIQTDSQSLYPAIAGSIR